MMKMALAFSLAALLLLSLPGCMPGSQAPGLSPQDSTPAPTVTSSEGVTVQVSRLDWEESTGGATLVVTWHNPTPYEAIYGTSYSIQRLEGNEWVSCQLRQDLAFNAIAYLLNPGQTFERSYRLAENFDVSAPGTYRFLTSCFVYDKGYYSTEYSLTAEFTVGGQ